MSTSAIITPYDETRLIPISSVLEGYAKLRVANPKVESALAKSLAHLGQLSPVVVAPSYRGTCELLDGFKRIRILKRQGRMEILARTVPAQKASAQKSLMFTLHGTVHGLRELEEALIVKSLHREDGLSQVEIGILLLRHKSWVSRRIALLERLTEEVLEHLVLGLLPLSVGRVLCQLPKGPAWPSPLPQTSGPALPRGNNHKGATQEKMLATILKFRLSSRECESLLRHLKKVRPEDADALLNAPYEMEPALSSPYSGKPLEAHLKHLSEMALGAIPKIRSALITENEHSRLLSQTASALGRCREACLNALDVNVTVP